jgi:hypothetical protein
VLKDVHQVHDIAQEKAETGREPIGPPHGSDVSTLPQTEHVDSFSETRWRADRSGSKAVCRFFMR